MEPVEIKNRCTTFCLASWLQGQRNQQGFCPLVRPCCFRIHEPKNCTQ